MIGINQRNSKWLCCHKLMGNRDLIRDGRQCSGHKRRKADCAELRQMTQVQSNLVVSEFSGAADQP